MAVTDSESVANTLIAACAEALEEGDTKLDRHANDICRSAVFELTSNAAIDIGKYRPAEKATAQRFQEYQSLLEREAWVSRALGSAEEKVKSSVKGVIKSFATTPTIATLLGSGPIALILRWVGVFEALGSTIGQAAGYLVVSLGLLAAGTLSYLARGASHAAAGIGAGGKKLAEKMSVIWTASARAEAHLSGLRVKFADGFQSFGRPPPKITVFERAQRALTVVSVIAVASLCLTLYFAQQGFNKGFRQGCKDHPESRSCPVSTVPGGFFGPSTTLRLRLPPAPLPRSPTTVR